ncbi:MAG: hypothetical protein IT249_02265 [Chitinophagaceae bacterium]|nr:hypothetical protein [Chitinophagaceae bacterium]
MQLQTVLDYKRLLNHISDLIEVSGCRNDYITKKLGIKPQNFSVKKQRVSWNPDEVEKLLTIIDNEDVENYLMLEQMRFLKNEETITLDELKKSIKWE